MKAILAIKNFSVDVFVSVHIPMTLKCKVLILPSVLKFFLSSIPRSVCHEWYIIFKPLNNNIIRLVIDAY